MKFKSQPYKHQLEEFENKKDTLAYALFWEQGTGKTKEILDQVQYLAEKGEIDSLLIVAPNMIHINWIKEEIPTHLGLENYVTHYYESSKAANKSHIAACEALLKTKDFAILAMSYDAFITVKGKDFAKKFLTKKKCMYILDESTRIKTPGSKRTKTIVASGRYAKYKRILTGTPVTQGPFDVYAPIKFLDETFWKRNGLASYSCFKNYFGLFEQKINRGTNRSYELLLGYQRLDEMNEILKPITSRVVKSEVLDLPEKTYTKRFFEMTKEQIAMYKAMRDEFIVFIGQNDVIEAPLALTRILKLHQITCGYIPDENNTFHQISEVNPRLEAFKEVIEDITTPTIIWCRFKKDIELIESVIGDRMVRFDGSVDNDQRQENLKLFKSGEKQFFVSTTEVGGTGLTLNEAKTVIYYTNNYKLENRLQSEDRCHRVGQNDTVLYIDIIAQNTIDEHIVKALRKKLDISRIITGDEVKEWL
jgi:SNF2 family DNA or RNA helicase